MKLIIITLLIAFNSYADVKIDISNFYSKSYSAKFKTQLEADDWIADNIANDSWRLNEKL